MSRISASLLAVTCSLLLLFSMSCAGRQSSAPAVDHEAAQTLFNQANSEAQMGQIKEAMTDFERVVKLDPNNAGAWQRLGLLYLRTRQFHRSVVVLEKAVALDPHDALSGHTLGLVALSMGKFDEAAAALKRVVAEHPDDAEAEAALGEVTLRLDPSPAGQAEAERLAQASLQSHPNARAYSTLGQIRMAQRRYDSAIEDLNMAIKMDPRSRANYLLLSQCYARAGKPDLARKASVAYLRLIHSTGGEGDIVR